MQRDAFQCPKMVSQINAADAANGRRGGLRRATKAAEADRLHKEGKHAEVGERSQGGARKLGITA